MTLEELFDTCRICGIIEEKYYEELTNMTSDSYK